MNKNQFLAGMFSISCLTPLSAQEWVTIQGSIMLADGTPLCAMVLANGQYMFSCDGTGVYDLDVPLDDNGQITLFSFVDNLAPFSDITDPGSFPFDVMMQKAAPGSPLINMTQSTTCSGTDRVRITGYIDDHGYPLCGMVLANGQQMFSCDRNLGQGRFDLDVPVDGNGQVTLFGFVDGFQPYRETFTAPTCDIRYASEEGVDFKYQLMEEQVTSDYRFCYIEVEAVNTTSELRNGGINWHLYEAPGVFYKAAAVSIYLPPNSRDTYKTPATFSTPTDFGQGCSIIHSWELNDIWFMHTLIP